MPRVRMPDGPIVDFPADTPREKIMEAIELGKGRVRKRQEYEASMEGVDPKVRAWMEELKAKRDNPGGPSGAMNMLQGMTFNHADDMARFVGADKFADRINQEQSQFREEHPWGAMAYEALGGVIPGAVAGPHLGASAVGKAFLSMPKLAQGAALGAGSGGLYQAGEEGSTWKDVAVGAGLGAGMGVAGHMAGRLVGDKIARRAQKVGNMRGGVDNIPTASSAALMDDAAKFYRTLDDTGAMVPRRAMQKLRRDMLEAMNFPGGTMPKDRSRLSDFVRGTMGDLLDNTQELSYKSLRQRRSHLTDLLFGGSPLDGEKEKMAMKALDAVNDALGLTDEMPGPLAKMLRSGNELWHRGEKARVLERILEYADVQTGKFSQSGLPNALQQEFKALYKKISPDRYTGAKRMAGWTADEVELVRRLAKGEPMSRIVNWARKAAPTGGLSIKTWIAMLFGGGILGGPESVAALGGLAGGAAVAQRRATNSMLQAARELSQKVSGTPPKQFSGVDPNFGRGMVTGSQAVGQPLFEEMLRREGLL